MSAEETVPHFRGFKYASLPHPKDLGGECWRILGSVGNCGVPQNENFEMYFFQALDAADASVPLSLR